MINGYNMHVQDVRMGERRWVVTRVIKKDRNNKIWVFLTTDEVEMGKQESSTWVP